MSDDLRSLLPNRMKPSNFAAGDDDGAAEDLDAPHARATNKPEFAFHVIGKAGDRTTFQYAHLDSHAELIGNSKMVLQFSASKLWKVTLTGRNLLKLYRLIHQHRLAWVRVVEPMQSAAMMAESVVDQAVIEEVTEDEEE